MAYLIALTSRLLDGLSRCPAEFRARHASFFANRQNPDGGFSGREGDSDLYYTGFALRGLAVLDALTPTICERAAPFLRYSATQQASVVDFFSFLFACFLVKTGGPDILADSPADWRDRVAAALEGFRTPDGGYAKTPGGPSGSTYHTFLVGLCYQLLERNYPRPEEVARFLIARRRDDGGFVEIAPMRRSGTNPTAAAVGAWQLLHGPETSLPDKHKVIEFLARMPSMEGGLRANDRVPLADLLSTFTGCWTLDQLGALNAVSKAEALRYAQSLEQADGGFHAGLWDDAIDIEYTFYGLGCVGLFS